MKIRQNEELIRRAYALFDEFYAKAAPLREKCRANEEFFKTNHWQGIPAKDENEPRPVTPVLFSTLENMLSDIMDNYPDAVVLGEDVNDGALADSLSKILRYIFKRRSYRATYRNKCRTALKCGTSVQEVFWDSSLYGGLGDVNIREWDIKRFLYDPKCENIQDGRAVFKYAFYTREYFDASYPGVWAELSADSHSSDENDKEDTAMIMEYWWKERKGGDLVVHMAKIAGGRLLENSAQTAPGGMYAHGMYPFIVEPLYALSGEVAGLGLIDILKNLQQYADKLDQIILKNALMSGKSRLLINKAADIDEGALLDWSREVIRGGRIDDGAVRWFQTAPLSPYVLTHFNSKLAAIKEESGQNQFVRGETLSGVTAASAIQALQEAGSKRSRLIIDQLYDGYESLVRMVIEIIRENYTEERCVMISGETARVSSAQMFKPAGDIARPIEFDVSVMVERQTPYRTASQNEFALKLLSAGLIGKTEALSLMSFDGKEKILESARDLAVDEIQL